MVAFVIGSTNRSREELEAALDYVRDFEGLTQIKFSDKYPGIAILCFDTAESAKTAQLLLGLAGEEGSKE